MSVDISHKDLKSQLKYAHRQGYTHVLLVGDAETAKGTITVRDMVKGTERRDVPLAGFVLPYTE